jgi:hypothetical protein
LAWSLAHPVRVDFAAAARWEQGRVAYDQAWAALRSSRPISEAAGGRRAAGEQCLTTALQASQYPAGFPHAFTLIYRRREQELLVEYEFPRVGDIIPTDASYRYVQARSFIEPKVRTATEVLPPGSQR